ncbi:hypothetical protein [Paraburkholderia sp. SIMBA_054]|uniref:hypothetical protein n=1 Tax=Paraburkholderia sp. SIMBA_054 TaxID=3085795 RepID=UPI003978549C
MATYPQLLAELRDLNAQIEKARAAEAAETLVQIRSAVAEFHFTAEDIFGKPKKRKARKQKSLTGGTDAVDTRTADLFDATPGE